MSNRKGTELKNTKSAILQYIKGVEEMVIFNFFCK